MCSVEFHSAAEQADWEIQAFSDNFIIYNSIFTFVISSTKIAVVPPDSTPLPTESRKRGAGEWEETAGLTEEEGC